MFKIMMMMMMMVMMMIMGSEMVFALPKSDLATLHFYGADDGGDDEIRLIWFAVKFNFFVETT